MSSRECNFGWESSEPCEREFHRCGNFIGHEGIPHHCPCGEELAVGATWVIGSSVNHRTGKRIAAKVPESATPALAKLVKPDEMIAWLTDLNSNWAVLRNTRSFLEGQPVEYWKKFDACMGEAFELQIALMKLLAPPAESAKEKY